MFGLALWDVEREPLILGRERIGEKPLYFSLGTEPAAVLVGTEVNL